MTETYADAKRLKNAIGRLAPLVESGQASDAEKRAYEVLKGQLPAAEAEIGKTGATYRGFTRGGTGGLKDEISGVYSAVTGDGYTQGREESLALDQAAKEAYPQEFNTGEFAGGGTLALGALGIGGPALAGANMVTKIGAGVLGGGILGGFQGQSDYEMAGRPPGQRLDYMKGPVITGAVTGGAAYPVGKLVGAGARGIRNARMRTPTGYGRKPTDTLTQAVTNTQESGQDISQYLNDLTDEAMLADVPGDLQGRAQGLAAMRGSGGARLARAVEDRAKGAGERIEDEVNTRLGQPNAAFEQKRDLATQRTGKWGPEYEAALSAEGAVQVRPLIAKLKEAQRVAGPDTAQVLDRFVGDLESKAKNGLIDPAQLHWIRSDLSDAAMGSSNKKTSLLGRALGDVDSVLDEVPGYKGARTGYGNTFAMEDAIEQGEKELRGGRATASSPEEFKARFDKLSNAQRDAFRTGLRRDIAALMGTSRNDAAAAWGEFAKNWNEEKLRIALGADAEPLIKRLRSENVFSQTRGKVTAGSKTAETQEQRDALGDYRDPLTGKRPGPVTRAKDAAGEKVNDLVDSLIYGNRTSNRNAELGAMLSLQGKDRDALVKALLLNAQQQKLPAPRAESLDRILRALVASGGGAASAAQNN